MKLSFYGAAKMVTGSNHLIEAGGKKLLLDCGLFQGRIEDDLKNFEDFPYNPSEIDYLILSHGHIDHSGRIPKLVKEGFTGRIITTKATFDLSKIMLLDCAKIQESDTEWENRKRKRSGKPLKEPLYTTSDAEKSFAYFETYYYGELIEIDENFTLRFQDAGHILGSSITELWVKEGENKIKIVYSGDLGVKNKAILKEPSYIEDADYVIMESTYGDKIHEDYEHTNEKLIEIIEDTAKKGGTVVIPSFAVGRTQELIYQLNSYYDSGNVEEYKKIPIYIDSPMAVDVTGIYEKNSQLFNKETEARIMSGDNPFSFSNLKYISEVEESKSLNKSSYPKVIISASGMADAGRVRHHLKHNLWDPKNTILFVGYQAQGTTGRKILEGISSIQIMGEEIKVRAKVEKLNGLSAHADMIGLLDWLKNFKKKPKKIYLVHGEKEAQEFLKEKIVNELKIETDIAEPYETVEINLGGEYVISEPIKKADLRESIEMNLSDIEKLYKTFTEKSQTEKSDKFLRKNFSEYNSSLIDLKSKLMELIMIESR